MTTSTASTEPIRPITPPLSSSRPITPASLTVPVQTHGHHNERTSRAPTTHTASQNVSQNASRAPSPRPSAIVPNTQVTYEDPDFHNPPGLNYSLRPRKKSIAIFWVLILLDCVALPIALYFGLWYGTSLSPNAVFSISTGTLGTVSIVEYFIRFRRLWRKGSTCRVIGAQRHYLDWFHWNISVGWFFVMIELIVGTIPRNPPIRLLAMPASTMCFALGVELLLIDILRLAGVPAPCRISSLPVGAPLRPGIYAYIEDIVAVDGSGGTEFRQRLNLRYQASRAFRMMLHRLTLFWGIGAVGIAAVTSALIWTIQRDAAYVVGWTVPFIWAGVWTAITIPWVQKCLKDEHVQWEHAKWKA
ncbi:hypothetical protein GQ43DRAFT_452707 [Delitschia confertaspora ATCC 74209]|uniref:Uncharacterized protein n=1 Tax=Delitschia confertaspora ATCC 74209 TaxID=1513339 RepID=A0A9P4JX60_9PLEO|nr:hypothetical protein GQ43DRAFT_452707 [Delitschia confertaspora ATCC 74209]